MPGFEILNDETPEEQERILAESREAEKHILGTTGIRGFYATGHPILTREQGEVMAQIIRNTQEKFAGMTREQISEHQRRTWEELCKPDEDQ